MPIKIADTLPARDILERENIFVMTHSRAVQQDIRPLRLVILNLMPTKIETETQLLRCLSNTPLQIEIELLRATSHVSKNTGAAHLESFYIDFDRIRDNRYDGMMITGAPVERLDFEKVDYWTELTDILDWSQSHVTSTFHICWGAQAALYHHYGIGKYELPQKLFGVYRHRRIDPLCPLTRGFDDEFLAPHSRYTAVDTAAVERCPDLQVLSVSDEAGLYIAASRDGRQIFVTGHSEYDAGTLAGEYRRDREKGIDTAVPANYFPGDDPALPPKQSWRSHAQLLYSNWLNYYVYQATPFVLG